MHNFDIFVLSWQVIRNYFILIKNAVEVGIIHFHIPHIMESTIGGTACSKIIRKWKWLVMNGCKCKSSLSTITKF